MIAVRTSRSGSGIRKRFNLARLRLYWPALEAASSSILRRTSGEDIMRCTHAGSTFAASSWKRMRYEANAASIPSCTTAVLPISARLPFVRTTSRSPFSSMSRDTSAAVSATRFSSVRSMRPSTRFGIRTTAGPSPLGMHFVEVPYPPRTASVPSANEGASMGSSCRSAEICKVSVFAAARAKPREAD